MAFAWWASLLMTVGTTWLAGALCLAFTGGEHLRVWQAVTSPPIVYLFAAAIYPKWRSTRGQQLAGVVHLALLAFAVVMVLLGRVPLSDGAWWRRVGAAAGAAACIWELVRISRPPRSGAERPAESDS